MQDSYISRIVGIHQGLVLMLCLGLFVGGCATTKPRFTYQIDDEGNIQVQKRIERNAQRDYLHRFTRTVYRKPKSLEVSADSEQQALVLHRPLFPWGDVVLGAESDQIIITKEWGMPDWVRKPFRSLKNETVQEWLYMDEDRMFQFVGDTLVYDGAVSDYERILLQRGYPNRHETIRIETDSRVDALLYEGIFFPTLEEYHFVNGVLVQSQEGN